MRLVSSAAVCVSVLAPALLHAQDILPGGNHTGAREERSTYQAVARLQIDSLARRWDAACANGNPSKVAELYARDAVFIATSGSELHGRGAVHDIFARALPRMKRAHLDPQNIFVTSDVAFVAGEVTFDVPLPTGGTYPFTAPVNLFLRSGFSGRWEIQVQSGGDVVAISAIDGLRPTHAAGDPDTLRVRITDVTGVGVPGVLVAFEVMSGAGTLAPAAVTTDANGIALTVFSAAPAPSAGAAATPAPLVVRAVASALVDEPVFFTERAEQTAAP